MPRAVLDTTILVSAFLTPKGLAAELLSHARRGTFHLYLSEEILEETQRVLLEREHIRKHHPYSDQQAIEFCQALRTAAHLATELPKLKGVARDPADDVILAAALKTQAQYLVTRDQDLLSLGTYKGIRIASPEDFVVLLRKA